jgi:hypothetical protein
VTLGQGLGAELALGEALGLVLGEAMVAVGEALGAEMGLGLG